MSQYLNEARRTHEEAKRIVEANRAKDAQNLAATIANIRRRFP